jgi:hypothetical protein
MRIFKLLVVLFIKKGLQIVIKKYNLMNSIKNLIGAFSFN